MVELNLYQKAAALGEKLTACSRQDCRLARLCLQNWSITLPCGQKSLQPTAEWKQLLEGESKEAVLWDQVEGDQDEPSPRVKEREVGGRSDHHRSHAAHTKGRTDDNSSASQLSSANLRKAVHLGLHFPSQ